MNADSFLRRLGKSRLSGTIPAKLPVRLLPPEPAGGVLYIADCVLLRRLKQQGTKEPIIILASSDAQGIAAPPGVRLIVTESCFADLCAILLSETEETPIDRLVSDLICQRLTDFVTLKDRLSGAGIHPAPYYHCLVAVSAAACEAGKVAEALGHIFPSGIFTVFESNCVGLLFQSEKQYGLGLKYDYKGLKELAVRFGLSIGFGNCSEYLLNLHAIYRQAEAAVKFGRIFAPEQRIYRYEDYSMYHIIETASGHSEAFGNLIYLCHPSIFPLLRYDRDHGGSIRQAVICYIKNSCSATFAAEELSLHRNTLINKIKKAEELIGGTLHDVALQERLLFSDRVVEYMEKVAGLDPLFMDRKEGQGIK